VFHLEQIPFSLHSAGHMLGSSQIRWERGGQRIVYTGDYKRQNDTSCDPFEVVACDIFITETTFAQPGKVHPPDSELIEILRKANETNLMIGAYNLGKAQRLTRMIQSAFPEMRIMIHPKIVPYHKIYENMGFSLGKWEPYKRERVQTSNRHYLHCASSYFAEFPSGKTFLKSLRNRLGRETQSLRLCIPPQRSC
jgi:putative mRNA 3-end processing factor